MSNYRNFVNFKRKLKKKGIKIIPVKDALLKANAYSQEEIPDNEYIIINGNIIPLKAVKEQNIAINERIKQALTQPSYGL